MGHAIKTDDDDFSENFQREGGVFSIQKFILQILDLYNFFWRFPKKKCNIIFKNEGGRSKAIWKISENSSVLVA